MAHQDGIVLQEGKLSLNITSPKLVVRAAFIGHSWVVDMIGLSERIP